MMQPAVEVARDFGIGILGLATGLVIYLWVFSFLAFDRILWRYRWYADLPRRRQSQVCMWAMIAGAVLLWIAVEYWLPPWWLKATPMIAPAMTR